MINSFIQTLATKILQGESISREEALQLMQIKEDIIFDLLFCANKIRQFFHKNRVHLCSILNARSGRCPEDCIYCAQSAFYKTEIPIYPLLSAQEIIRWGRIAKEAGAKHFGIVTSGRAIKPEADFSVILDASNQLKENVGITPHISIGEIDYKMAIALKNAGVVRVNHNLETSERFFPKICTTHKYSDRKKTAEVVKEAGLELCCGGIFGLGENDEDRIDLAFALRELQPESVPLNFIHPIHGTPCEKMKPLPPLEILKIIGIFRFILPNSIIIVAGGREKNLGDFQSWIYLAGANGIIIGNYLTTPGRPPQEDLEIIADLHLEPY